ncbi:MAG TPA: enoyl-CoA hydratase/isomerase family protein [Acidimicrobiales bacterium]|nr:enoyl-CoA hydratase/isomerase family protein [Acidimicrobiales bacterium]
MSVDVRDDRVALIEMRRPPHNFFSPELVEAVADALEGFDDDPAVRAAVLAAEGRSFCAGANLSGNGGGVETDVGPTSTPVTARLYEGAARLCAVATPVVAAVHGPAIGGGLGLALTASMRVTCPEARFSANFAKLGIHHGFGLSTTLPELVGPSRAALVLLTGRRFTGEEATSLGLADVCVPADQVRTSAIALAGEIAENAPLAVKAINRTLRAGLADRVRAATAHEAAEQARLGATRDAREGLLAVSERRPGSFTGR